MATALHRLRRDPQEEEWPDETRDETQPWDDARLRPVDLDQRVAPVSNKQPSPDWRASRAVIRFLATFCVGVAATLTWQSYGDAARATIASSYPQLGWLAPPPARLPQSTADAITPAEPAAPSADALRLNAMSLDLTAVRQSLDQLAAQLASGNQQIAGDISALQSAQQAILHKMATPAPRPPAAPQVRNIVQPPPPEPPPPR
jgi:hypothetical protein